VDRQTRHELKSDKFVEEVTHTVEYIEEHKSQVAKYGGIAAAVIVLAAGGWYYTNTQRVQRQAALGDAVAMVNFPVGPAPEGQQSFPTPEAKDKAVEKAFNDIITKYSGSNESGAAMYMLGLAAADKGKMADAERLLRQASQEADKEFASIARLALADVLAAIGKAGDAEKELRDLIAKPTTLVPKDQATLSLARVLAKTKPAEAKKLLEPLRTVTGPASASAISMISEFGL
jgi:TolA-binding protein